MKCHVKNQDNRTHCQNEVVSGLTINVGNSGFAYVCRTHFDEDKRKHISVNRVRITTPIIVTNNEEENNMKPIRCPKCQGLMADNPLGICRVCAAKEVPVPQGQTKTEFKVTPVPVHSGPPANPKSTPMSKFDGKCGSCRGKGFLKDQHGVDGIKACYASRTSV